MKINTTFNVGDTAYVLENNSCYKVKVTEIDVNIDEEGVEVGYDVEKEIPRGLLRTDTKNTCYQEEELFLSKQDVKNKLKEIEEHKKKGEELGLKCSEEEYIWTIAGMKVMSSSWGGFLNN